MERIKFYHVLLFLSSFLWSHHSIAQDWTWANFIPFNVPTNNTPVYIEINTEAITHDAARNAYVTGNMFAEDGDTDENSYIFFIAKFNASGNVMWLKKYGVPFESYSKGEDIIADAAGNVYVTGTFQGILQFSNTISLTCTGGFENDIFIAKYDSQGVVQWARKAGGNSWDSSHGIALDPQGNILITGSIIGTAYFGNSVFALDTSPNSSDYFVAKYDQSGHAQWVKRGSTSNYNESWGMRISVDSLG